MKISIDSIINSSINKVGLCVASGPSLNRDLSKILNVSINKRNVYSLFSVNDIDRWYNLKSDYRVFANSELTVIKMFFEFYKNRKTKILFAESVDLTPKIIYKFLLYFVDYFPYDQRHFNNNPCKDFNKCCARIDSNTITIQEVLQKYCSFSLRYGSGHTVALHMLAFSIISGCKEIYIFGVDLNYNLGYSNSNVSNIDSFDPWLDEILFDFEVIYKSALNIGVKVYSCSIDSPLNKVIPFKEFDENS